MGQSQILWVGIGCQRGVSSQLIKIAVDRTLQKYQLAYQDILGITTIDTKASESGLWEFCDQHNLPLKTFTAEVLSTVTVPNPAKIVKKNGSIKCSRSISYSCGFPCSSRRCNPINS